MFVNKNLRLIISNTKTAMNAKISIFVILVEAIIYFYYYIICMTEPFTNSLKLMLTSNCIAINERHSFAKKLKTKAPHKCANYVQS